MRSWTRPIIAVGVAIATLAPSWATGQPAGQDAVARAREMAFSGQRSEALGLLDEYLDTHPSDTEARTLFGTVLSWEGQYDEARRQLQSVLDGNPTHGDALPALANVELWSDHPERAESLATAGLSVHPSHAGLLITRARALWNLSRERDALDTVNQALELDTGNETALSLRRALQDTQRYWEADVTYAYDFFSDDRSGWHETRYSLTRQTTLGSLIARFSRADRFGITDQQFEVEMYPRFREGTYAWVSGAFAPSPSLFPEYRVGGDIYQSLRSGFEVSAGYRRLQFTDSVNIYVGSLTKYHGNWMLTGRVYATPNNLGTSTSVHGIVRHYNSDGVGYIGVRYGRGAFRDEVRSLNDITLLNSDTFGGEIVLPIGTLELWLGGSASREERAGRPDLWQFATTSSIGVRF